MTDRVTDSLESPYIHAGNSDNFTPLVLQNSKLGPVLVNFWSKKAGPCLRQYPVLDKVIHRYGGKVLLVNIDVDREIKICNDYGIASVPTLKLFRHEEVIQTLHGYQSEADVTKLLDSHVSSNHEQAIVEALSQYSQGQVNKAFDILTHGILSEPDNVKLPEVMCKLLIREKRVADAEKLIDSLPSTIRNDAAIVSIRNELGSRSDSSNKMH